MKSPFTYAILGGTFDRLHAGHKALIDAACERSKKIHIGITTKNFSQNKILSQTIQPYKERRKAIAKYLQKKQLTTKVTLIKLKDIYGESLTEKAIDAIFVTQDTLPNAQHINTKMKQLNFPPIEIITIPLIPTEDNYPITSERIRKGEIDRNGHVYLNHFKTNLCLPEHLRKELRKPIGEIVTLKKIPGSTPHIPLITVGDIVTLSCLNTGLTPSLSIVDFKTQRTKLNEQEIRQKLPFQKGTYPNLPGTINNPTVQILQQKIQTYLTTKQPQVLMIDGEEDLLALPTILLAPLNTLVLYGQIGQGAILVKVTEKKIEQVKKIITKFTAYP